MSLTGIDQAFGCPWGKTVADRLDPCQGAGVRRPAQPVGVTTVRTRKCAGECPLSKRGNAVAAGGCATLPEDAAPPASRPGVREGARVESEGYGNPFLRRLAKIGSFIKRFTEAWKVGSPIGPRHSLLQPQPKKLEPPLTLIAGASTCPTSQTQVHSSAQLLLHTL